MTPTSNLLHPPYSITNTNILSGDRLNTTASNDSAVFNELENDAQNEIVYEEIPETPSSCSSPTGINFAIENDHAKRIIRNLSNIES